MLGTLVDERGHRRPGGTAPGFGLLAGQCHERGGNRALVAHFSAVQGEGTKDRNKMTSPLIAGEIAYTAHGSLVPLVEAKIRAQPSHRLGFFASGVRAAMPEKSANDVLVSVSAGDFLRVASRGMQLATGRRICRRAHPASTARIARAAKPTHRATWRRAQGTCRP